MQYNQTLQGLCVCVNDSYTHYNAILHRLLTQFCKEKYIFFFRTTWHPRCIPRKSYGYIPYGNYLYIVRIVSFRTYNDVPSLPHLSMTRHVSNPPSNHPIAVFEDYGHYGKYRSLGMSENGAYIYIYIIYLLQIVSFRTYNDVPSLQHLSMTRYVSNPPSNHPIAVFEDYAHYGKYRSLGMSETLGIYIYIYICILYLLYE